jgi:hypothetical protein
MENLDGWFLAADQCRARAELIRRTADNMQSQTVRLNLCSLAERYEEIAARIERSAGTAA